MGRILFLKLRSGDFYFIFVHFLQLGGPVTDTPWNSSNMRHAFHCVQHINSTWLKNAQKTVHKSCLSGIDLFEPNPSDSFIPAHFAVHKFLSSVFGSVMMTVQHEERLRLDRCGMSAGMSTQICKLAVSHVTWVLRCAGCWINEL